MIKYWKLLCAVLVSLCVASCSDDVPEPKEPRYKHTVIVYMAADNSLSADSNADIDEMKSALGRIPEGCQVVVFHDDNNALHKPQLLLLRSEGYSVYKEYVDEVNSADAKVVGSVLAEVMGTFPSDEYSLVLWSHGSNWKVENGGASKVSSRAVLQDVGFGGLNGAWLNIAELREVLMGLPQRMGFVMFDACFMQSVEVAAELYDLTDWIIASPVEIPGVGAPYGMIMEELCRKDIGGIVSNYHDYCIEGSKRKGVLLSAIDCAEFEAFAAVTARYVSGVFRRDAMPSLSGVQIFAPRFRADRVDWPIPSYDVRSVMAHLLDEGDYGVWEAQWRRTVPYCVGDDKWDTIYAGSGYNSLTDADNYGGVAMSVPDAAYEDRGWNDDFGSLRWYGMAGWDKTGW